MFRLLVVARSFGYASTKAIDELSAISDLRLTMPQHSRAFNESEMLELVPGQDMVIVGTDQMSARVLEASPDLKVVSKHGVGIDNIDVVAATRAGVLITYLPGFNSSAVADMALALMLALSRRVCEAADRTKAGSWGKILGHDVWGKTLGVIGTGRIGQEVIRRALSFEMKVVAFDTFPSKQAAATLGYQYVSLDELLERSEIITIHVPLTPETRNMIGARELGMMREAALLINTSRGGIVDERALIKSLETGGIGGAAIDVFEETLRQSDKVKTLPNLIVTPHIAAYTYETLELMDVTLVAECRRLLRGEKPEYTVNPEIWDKVKDRVRVF